MDGWICWLRREGGLLNIYRLGTQSRRIGSDVFGTIRRMHAPCNKESGYKSIRRDLL